MSNLFDRVATRIKDSPAVLYVMFLMVLMLLIGINHFVEDTYSSYYGIKELELRFGMVPASYALTYFSLSLTPQVGFVVFMYLYGHEQKNVYLFGGVAFMLIDLISDVQYRSNGVLFPFAGEVFNWSNVLAAFLFTLTAYTIGSEVFISISLGMIVSLAIPSITQAIVLYIEIRKQLDKAGRELKKPTEHNNPRQSQDSSRQSLDNPRQQPLVNH